MCKLKHTILDLQKLGKTIELCWIPGLAGIPENETADKKKAKRSIKTTGRNDFVPPSRRSSQYQPSHKQKMKQRMD